MNPWLKTSFLCALLTASAAALAEEPKTLIEEESSPPAITVSTPKEISLSSLGLTPAAELELPETLWKDLDSAELSSLLKALTGGVVSDSLRGLAVRSLAASAEFPEGGGNDLIAQRADALLALGQAALARDLLARIPAGQRSPGQQQLAFLLAAMSAEDAPNLCETAEENLSAQADPFWQRWVVLCHAKAGEADKAQLGLDLLSEQNEFSEFFQKLTRSLREKKPLVKLPDVVFLEQAAWLYFAAEQRYLAEQKNLSLAVIGLFPPEKLPEAWRETARRYGLHRNALSVPQNETYQPDIAGLRLPAEADSAQKRRAFLTYGLRKALDLPVSLGAEQVLGKAWYRAEGVVLSPAWRETLRTSAEKGQAGKVALLLAGAITGEVNDYAPADLAMAVEALRQCGLEKDASLLAQEAMRAASKTATKQ